MQSSENELTSSTGILTVKLPFQSKSKSTSGKKRVSRALSKAYRRVETLEYQNEELRRKLKTAQKRLQRYDQKKNQVKPITNTPTEKTDRLLKESGIYPKRVQEVRKKLIYGERLSLEVKLAKETQGNKSNRKQIIHRVASGRVMKRYRMMSTLEKHTQLNRKCPLLPSQLKSLRRYDLSLSREK
ncbi:hypothetical protein DPMN_128655 [Dreissena polymorpha]|uniref:Uncharacterized protein n=1 Tax=Dreissena polymorpha TaxID=45954 RepID=A0A9D4JVY8_DREPO|nr:hypothetical protein DPMN_128655 [Dreissena polymorpha]